MIKLKRLRKSSIHVTNNNPETITINDQQE